jgi:cystathionine beta-lyase/cystathionine gamma-synthase
VRGVPVRAGDSAGIEAAVRDTPDVGVVLIETPANPTLTMTDLRHAAACASRRPDRPLVMVDNTLLGPVFQHPFRHGADVVLYSATKYLSGFSDLIGGFALTRDAGVAAPMRSLRGLFGTILQPDECWILNGRLPTVALRMRQSTENARMIVEALARHPKVARIHYPTQFEDAEQIRIREAQCQGAGAMFALELKGGKRAAFEFLRHVHIARDAVSLGGVETLVCHPRSTTHSGFTDAEFAQAGVTEDMVRFSIGVEDWRDLLADFERALEHA